MSDKIFRVVDSVRMLMEKYDDCRNSDLWLLIRYWQEVDGIRVYFPFTQIPIATSAETITRSRRLVQKDGDLLPTNPSVVERRGQMEKKMRETFGRLSVC